MGRYSKHPWSKKPVVLLIEDAGRSKRPAVIRNGSLEARVRRLTIEQIELLITCYQEGDSTYALARRFGINRHTVTDHLQRNAIAVRK
jgi:DNA-binding CsgD family transcriptional regulator